MSRALGFLTSHFCFMYSRLFLLYVYSSTLIHWLVVVYHACSLQWFGLALGFTDSCNQRAEKFGPQFVAVVTVKTLL